jgi:hypothetical protein
MEKISIGEIFCFELRDPKDVMVGKEFSAQFGNESLFISFTVLRPNPPKGEGNKLNSRT